MYFRGRSALYKLFSRLHDQVSFKSLSFVLMGTLLNTNVAQANELESGQIVKFEVIGDVSTKTVSDSLGESEPRIWSYHTDETQQEFSVDGPRTDVIDISYVKSYNQGQTIEVTNALGHISHFEYDQDRNPVVSRDANGTKTLFTYEDGQLVSVTFAAETPLESVTSIEYEDDEIQRISSSESTRWFDVTSNEQRTLGNGSELLRAVDEAVSYTKLEWLDNHKFGDGGVSLVEKIIDSSPPSQMRSDEWGRVTSLENALGHSTDFVYDEYGHLTKVQDARGVETTYVYNGYSEVVSELTAQSGEIKFSYDLAGNVDSEERTGGVVIKRRYDALNRMIRKVYKKDGQKVSAIKYVYDNCENGLGRLCSISTSDIITRYNYNALGLKTEVTTKYNAENSIETSRYFYGAGGRLEKVHYPTDLVVKYHYSDIGDVKKITGRYGKNNEKNKFTIAENIKLNSVGQLTNIIYGNGLKTVLAYGSDGQLLKQSTSNNGQLIDRYTYDYDSSGNVTAIGRLNDDQSKAFVYDAVGQLLNERIGGRSDKSQSIAYTYDEAGNRTNRHADQNSRALSYSSNSNQLNSINRQTTAYDISGNLVEDRNGKRAFSYDITNRLKSYSSNNDLRASYSYDAFGRRVRKYLHRPIKARDNYSTLTFAYTPDGGLLSETANRLGKKNVFANEYIWLGKRPIAQLSRIFGRDNKTRRVGVTYIHADHMHAPRSATNEEGSIVWSWEADAFGSGKANNDVDEDGIDVNITLRFPGQYYDKESGLHYNHNRDYDPKSGRYIQSDPIGLIGGVNRYAYALSNPVNNFDSSGLKTCTGSRIKRAANYNCGGGATNVTCMGNCGSFSGFVNITTMTTIGGGSNSSGTYTTAQRQTRRVTFVGALSLHGLYAGPISTIPAFCSEGVDQSRFPSRVTDPDSPPTLGSRGILGTGPRVYGPFSSFQAAVDSAILALNSGYSGTGTVSEGVTIFSGNDGYYRSSPSGAGGFSPSGLPRSGGVGSGLNVAGSVVAITNSGVIGDSVDSPSGYYVGIEITPGRNGRAASIERFTCSN